MSIYRVRWTVDLMECSHLGWFRVCACLEKLLDVDAQSERALWVLGLLPPRLDQRGVHRPLLPLPLGLVLEEDHPVGERARLFLELFGFPLLAETPFPLSLDLSLKNWRHREREREREIEI